MSKRISPHIPNRIEPVSGLASSPEDGPQSAGGAQTVPLPRAYAESLRPLGIRVRETGELRTYRVEPGRDGALGIVCHPGVAPDAAPDSDADAEVGTLIELDQETWRDLQRDLESAAGLIYGGRMRCLQGDPMHFVHWEPALRWLFVGRPVYDPETIDLRDRRGKPLDPARSFALGDDREEMAHFLRTAGYLWVRGVLSPEELASLRKESERLRSEAREGDQESWWGRRADGTSVLCRVLRAGSQPAMRALHSDARLRGLVDLCDTPMKPMQEAEANDGVTLLWKQPGVEEGLGDLPWHRDCGMGGHASMCPTAVVSIFLGPNTPEAGELRFLPGSWTSSMPFAEAHAAQGQGIEGVAPPAQPGDVTLHYGDGMHVAPPPTSAEGPHRSCILLAFARRDGYHHRGGRHYNDVLLGGEDGQISNLTKMASKV
jgi:hypothetical protein